MEKIKRMKQKEKKKSASDAKEWANRAMNDSVQSRLQFSRREFK